MHPNPPPVVSVVIPTRNRVGWLRQCVHSVRAQRDVLLELIVVDEGSSDGTAEYLADLQACAGAKLVIHQTPRGLPAARNAGLAIASGRYVAFLDDDDLWAPDKLAGQIDAIERTPGARWATASALHTDARLAVLWAHRLERGGDLLDDLLAGNVVPAGGSGVLVERSFIAGLGGFDESLTSAEDWDMWIRLAERSPVAVADGPLVLYRLSAGSMSHDSERWERASDVVVAKSAVLRQVRGARFDVAARQRNLGRQDLQAGHNRRAATRWLSSARLDRSPRDAIRAVMALAAPTRLTRARISAGRAAIPAGWLAQTEAWLTDLPAP